MTDSLDVSDAGDAIDRLAAVAPGSALDDLRRRRPVTRAQLQASAEALFEPVDDTELSVAERLLVAAFATRLTAADDLADDYARRAREVDADAATVVIAAASASAVSGPYGTYAEPGLQAENADGLRWEPGADLVDAVGPRLAAALAHAHLLTFRPREARDGELARLRAAGFSVEAIVTLSQLVAFLAFQQRVAAGLRALNLAGVTARRTTDE